VHFFAGTRNAAQQNFEVNRWMLCPTALWRWFLPPGDGKNNMNHRLLRACANHRFAGGEDGLYKNEAPPGTVLHYNELS
jgi:hypothetical protein